MDRERTTIRISVRNVVEFTCHDSDLTPAGGVVSRMQEGTRAHKARQGAGKEQFADYQAEVSLAADYITDDLVLHVEGRADALYTDEDGMTVVEEIKLGSVESPLTEAHRMQAAFYGHMLCVKGEKAVRLRVLYVNEKGMSLMTYTEEHSAEVLRGFFEMLCEPAATFEKEKAAWRNRRNESIAHLAFPFPEYRPGQRRFAGAVYGAIRDKKRLFAQAPTGTGKTMAALFPAVHALAKGYCQRIFYLTARTTGRETALDAIRRLENGGACLHTVEIAAKDKVCPRETRDCRPEVCPYASGYYDRLPHALEAAAGRKQIWSVSVTAELAEEYMLCPFELSLALAGVADIIVGDINYAFDPAVSLQVLLPGSTLLVDEAHQLADRVRDAYSAEISAEVLRELRRETGKSLKRKSRLYRSLTEAIRVMESLPGTEKEPPEAVTQAMTEVMEASREALGTSPDSGAVLEVFMTARAYCLAAGRYDDRYDFSEEGIGKNAVLHIHMLDAAPEILSVTKQAKGTVYFSATLSPVELTAGMLGALPGDVQVNLSSPFDVHHLQVEIAPVEVRYSQREKNAGRVADSITAFLHSHAGNTLIFFSSYAYLQTVYEQMREKLQNRTVYLETRGMDEKEKQERISAFYREDNLVMLCVLGGAYGEGIDLRGDALRNVIVVSLGMPTPDARTLAMQRYYDSRGQNGFLLSMVWPGIIRVIQAAGRLIRSETDEGSLLLIDARYMRKDIRALFSGTLIGDAMDRRTKHEEILDIGSDTGNDLPGGQGGNAF